MYSLAWFSSNFLFPFLTMISKEQYSNADFDNLAWCFPCKFTTVVFYEFAVGDISVDLNDTFILGDYKHKQAGLRIRE